MPPAATVNNPSNFASTRFNAGSTTQSGRTKARLFKQRRSSKPSSLPPLHSGTNPFKSPVTPQNDDFDVGFVFGVSDSGRVDKFGTEIGKNGGSNVVGVGKNGSLGKEGFNCSDHVRKSCFKGGFDTSRGCSSSNVFGQFDGRDNVGFVFEVLGSSQVEGKNGSLGNKGFRKSGVEGDVDASNGCSSNEFGKFEERDNVGFVFDSKVSDGIRVNKAFSSGKQGLNCGDNVRKPRFDESFGVGGGGGFVFSAGSEAELSNGLKKLNMEHNKSKLSKDKDSVFVFKSDAIDSSLSNRTCLGEKENGAIDKDRFVFGGSGSSVNSGCFKPDLGSIFSFCANLPNGFETKEHSMKSRVCKGKMLKKTKAKSRQAKTTYEEALQKPLSSECAAQCEETPESYSPMDFSPYEDSRLNNDVPHSGRQNENSNTSSQDVGKLAFTASGSNNVSSMKRPTKKKYRLKTANGSATQGSSFVSKLQSREVEEDGCESALSAAEKACDKWRRRGSEAYEKGELSKAEELYTWGVNCIPTTGGQLGVSIRALVRCYSNRAATRMALGRVSEAIGDCLMAVKMDPTFHRAQTRAANCYLLLGELEDAMQFFGKLMDSTNVIYLDRQSFISASDGIQKSQKVIECMNRSAELLKLRTSAAAASALELIDEALLVSLYSEKLLEMKAEALCMLGKCEEVITLCQQSLDFAEKNFAASTSGKHGVNTSCLDVRLWRCHISSKCNFHLGKLEVALDLLEKQEFANKTPESPDPLAVSIRELLKQKSAGNTAFQSGKHTEAIEHYTSAILSSMESRPFAAICFCNRAAAHQALGQIADAIADCSLAIVLDENYSKAVSGRATLHAMIRDYKQAAADLQRLVSLLEKQSREKLKLSGSGNGKELRQVQQRLCLMEEEAKREVPLDLYLILGIKKQDSTSEIKKAYRKAALRHHPDKAAQSLVRSDAGDEGRIWKNIADLVHKDSNKLFKMIGEAYAVLSDPKKREEYDHEEVMKKALKESNNLRSTSRRYSENFHQGYPFERSGNRRYWHESYRR